MSEVFGQVYAPAYDLLYREKDYDGEIELLSRVFRQYADRPVRTILDLGCGTGNHALRLATIGYQVVGIDRSSEMLAVADRKAREQAVGLQLHQADIGRLELGQTFDAVLMMFAVLGYQQEDAEVIGVLQTARRHLRRNGLLLFDVWYGPAVVAQGPEERIRSAEQDGNTWMRHSLGQLDKQRNLCHVEFHLQRRSGNRILEEVRERHTVRYLFAEEIDRFLKDADFRLLRLGAFPAFDRNPDHTTWNVMAVAVAV